MSKTAFKTALQFHSNSYRKDLQDRIVQGEKDGFVHMDVKFYQKS